MSDPTQGPQPTLASDDALEIRRACGRFARAWREAVAGGPRPVIDSYVEPFAEPARTALREELVRIAREFEAQPGAPTRVVGEGQDSDDDVPFFVETAPAGGDKTELLSAGPAAAPAGERAAAHPQVAGYEIVGELGRGAMGVVYKARQAGLNRLVALKMLLAGAHAGAAQRARFHTEAEAVARLVHPNIVQIYEVGEQDGLPFFSLEFVQGRTLAEKIAGQPQPPRAAAQLVEALARAMHVAHAHGVVHRDLKPANILIADDGTPKITDFGLAKRLEADSSQTRTGTVLGTPSYMAPEQVRGDVREVGPPADVYALGSILYEMLTGRPPFLGATLLDTLEQVRTLEPVPPSRLESKIPRDLETICLKCLQKDAAKRYAGALPLAEDLRRYLRGEPILARPVSGSERLWRWCRRNPRVAVLGAAVLVLLVAVAVTSTSSAVLLARKQAETEREKKVAEEARDLAERKTHEAEAARGLADENARVASAQGSLAVNALYTVVTKVQNRLQGVPGMQKLRRELLNEAFAGLERVVSSADSSALVSRTRAAAYQRMGDICLETGQSERALEYYQQCHRVTEALARTDAGSDTVLWNLAVIHDKLGDVYHQLLGDGTVARGHYQKCLELRRDLSNAHLKTPELKPDMVKTMLATSYAKQGNLALVLGDPAAAWGFYRQFLQLQEGRSYATLAEALAAQINARGGRRYAPSFYLRLGDLSLHQGDPATARGFYEKALQAAQAAATASPTGRAGRLSVAAATASLGDWELQVGDPQKALDHYRRAHALYDAMATANPDSAEDARELALSFYRLGTAQLRLGDAAGARQAYAESLKRRQALAEADPKNVYKQIDLMLALTRSDRPAEAADRAAALRARAPKDPGMLFYAACTYALCSASPGADGERYAALALETLAQALANGYADRVALKLDPDLGPLRGRPEYRALCERLAPG